MEIYSKSKIWFVTGAQLLYGGETVRQVNEHSETMISGLNRGGLPLKIVYRGTVNSAEEVTRLFREAEDGFAPGHEDGCAAQRLVVGRGVRLVEGLQEQDACHMEVGMFLGECGQVADGIFVDGVRAPDVVYEVSLHVGCSRGC